MGSDRCFAVAKLIKYHKDKIQEALINRDINIIDDFMQWCKYDENLSIKPYSFFTKFCALYTDIKFKNCSFPIYDSLVENILILLKKDKDQNIIKQDKLYLTQKSLKKYDCFYEVMDTIREKYSTDFRKLDVFLWREGKILLNEYQQLDELKKRIKELEKKYKTTQN